MKFVQSGDVSGVRFRPMDYLDAYAVAFKPTRIDRNRGPVKSEAHCTLAVFDAEDSEPRVIENVIVTHGEIFWALARAYQQGAILVGYIGQGELTKYGTQPWIVRDLAPEDAERIAKMCEEVFA